MKILEVVSRKLKVDEDVDWEYYAERTEGFSGADLQALVYNAHLDVIHSAMDGVGLNNKQGGDSRDGSSSTGAIDHVEIQGVGKKSVVSQAEGAKLMNRVSAWFTSIVPTRSEIRLFFLVETNSRELRR